MLQAWSVELRKIVGNSTSSGGRNKIVDSEYGQSVAAAGEGENDVRKVARYSIRSWHTNSNRLILTLERL
jgi:hypothetical protein